MSTDKETKKNVNLPIFSVRHSALTKKEKYAKGYCKTCDAPTHKETRDYCENHCDGYLGYMQDD